MIGDNIQLQVLRRGRRRASLLVGAAAVLLAFASSGCSILGGDSPARTWYELTDLHADAAGASEAKGSSLVLLISPASESSFYDGTAIAFSRQSGSRAYYQYAAWTERPVKRLAQMLEHRLAARHSFGTVAQATAGVRGDLLLNLRLEEIYLDAAQPPGSARVAVTAELLDWRARKVIERKRFERVATVESDDSAQAAAGFNRAITRVLDELSAWLEQRAGVR
ncbi:MAG: membrane integrity-associated transporter subunit PqiC [Burkholderiaceae bacterium]|nr:membrane integrity-associated transporter subunit PqiC [Burkholderiaceae bacterium]